MTRGSCSDGKHPSLPTLRLWIRITKGAERVEAWSKEKSPGISGAWFKPRWIMYLPLYYSPLKLHVFTYGKVQTLEIYLTNTPRVVLLLPKPSPAPGRTRMCISKQGGYTYCIFEKVTSRRIYILWSFYHLKLNVVWFLSQIQIKDVHH